jgi:phosphoglycolate phosphatase-like HAD superfamily hydrolase
MLLLASRSLAEPKDCIMIGDRPEDKTAAETCGIKFFWASVLRKEQE